jgi:hypothetical protein
MLQSIENPEENAYALAHEDFALGFHWKAAASVMSNGAATSVYVADPRHAGRDPLSPPGIAEIPTAMHVKHPINKMFVFRCSRI